jgi:hypothetical protein
MGANVLDYSTLIANYNFEIIPWPSATHVSVADAVCKDTDVFNKDCISLADIIRRFSPSA